MEVNVELFFNMLQTAASTQPILSGLLMLLGVIFILCELFVKATSDEDDDKKWLAFKSGYMGPFVSFCIRFFKAFINK